jgi:DNA-nicking Smr family endonuclease
MHGGARCAEVPGVGGRHLILDYERQVVSRKRATQIPPVAKRTKNPAKGVAEAAQDPLFRASVSDVAPLPPRNKAALHKPRPRPVPRAQQHENTDGDELSDQLLFPRAPGEPLSFSRPGVQRQALRQLRRGGSSIEDELDLHGLTVAAARPLLVAFLNACGHRGLRRVRIIHGKGMRSEMGEGVLKGMVASWLAQRDDVLAYHEARPADGGSGAVIVLLRTAR